MPDSKPFDVLAFGAHPDDVELSAGGTVCRLVDEGYRVGIVDITRGELGSRGSAELRHDEAQTAAAILGVQVRENLGIPDGDIRNTPENRAKIIRVLRKYRPGILLINAPECRHPDHANAARLVGDAVFYSGLSRLETIEGDTLEPWRPRHVLHYMQSLSFEPTLVVDVSDVWERRMEALLAYKSQFHVPEYKESNAEPETFVSNPDFLRWIESRGGTFGYRIGARFGEPFLYRHGPIGTDDVVAMLGKDRPYR
jgi:bacillithiol biosynthesis deacetylase BshB1